MSDRPYTITLTFDPTDPDGRRHLRDALQGEDMRLVLWELDQWLRGQVEYGLSDDFLHSIDRKPGSITTEQEDIVNDSLNAVRQALAGICDDHGIVACDGHGWEGDDDE